MKIRIAFGLDTEAATSEEHRRSLQGVADSITKFYSEDLAAPVGWTLSITKATAVVVIEFPAGRPVKNLHVFGCFLPRIDIYRWTNISKEE